MHRESDARLIRRAALAALIGAAIGAGAGVYSLGSAVSPADEPPAPAALSTETPPAPPSQTAPAIESPRSPAESIPIATNGIVAGPPHDPPPPKRDPTRPSVPAPADSAAAVVARARSLADRQDVLGLIALREAFVRAAEARGDADSAGVKSVLDQVDQRLNDARMMRLKSDAEQFRRAAAVKQYK